MIYSFLRKLRSSLAVRLSALLVLLFMPVFVVIGVVYGLILAIIKLLAEVWDCITVDVPSVIADLFGAVRSGKVRF